MPVESKAILNSIVRAQQNLTAKKIKLHLEQFASKQMNCLGGQNNRETSEK